MHENMRKSAKGFVISRETSESSNGLANNNSTKAYNKNGTPTSKFHNALLIPFSVFLSVLATCGNVLAQHILLSRILAFSSTQNNTFSTVQNISFAHSTSRCYDAQLKLFSPARIHLTMAGK